MNAQHQQKGFTIIEVVLVLAIAALIFLMIFVALPALQRGQRDTARKQDVGRIVTAISNYRSNNSGSLDDLNATRLGNYLNDETGQIDPDAISFGSGNPEDTDTAVVTLGSKCGADGSLADGSSSRQAAVRTRLESGGNNVFYCEEA